MRLAVVVTLAALGVVLVASMGARPARAQEVTVPTSAPATTEPPTTAPPATEPPTTAPPATAAPTTARPKPTTTTVAPTTTTPQELPTLPPVPPDQRVADTTPSTIAVATSAPDEHLDPRIPALSAVGFAFALLILGLQWILTRPSRAGRPTL